MLWPLPLVAVRQKQCQTAEPSPLGAATADKLVDDNLSAVGEVAELCLPDHQRVWLSGGVTILEAQHGFL